MGMVYTHRRGRSSVHEDPEALKDAARIGANLVKAAELVHRSNWDWEHARPEHPNRIARSS
ncbi:hypothetical protein [Marinithermus hydrothermalis]|nr:hypothetical protein [Marinithermus hydrothermalis]